MVYTVKKMSELSGVTVRALHFYEKESLLKPAYYGSNGYRYYGEKELLQLQQILFFKELGFSLKQIKKVLGRSDFDQLAALYSHQQALSREGEKIRRLLKTIDQTIQHLNGKKKMKDKEMFDGFHISLVKVKEGQTYSAAEKRVAQSVKNPTRNAEDVAKRGSSYYDPIIQTAEAIFTQLAQLLVQGLDPEASEVQKIIQKHHAFVSEYLQATQEVYSALAQLYEEQPEFRKQIDPFHPDLAPFMSRAMRHFAQLHLK